MRTGRSLTICRSLLPRGVSAPGVSAPGGLFARRGVWLARGCLLQGVSAPRGCLLLGAGGIPACTEADTPLPPVNRMTNRCKNITLATTSLRPVISNFQVLILKSICTPVDKCSVVVNKVRLNMKPINLFTNSVSWSYQYHPLAHSRCHADFEDKISL